MEVFADSVDLILQPPPNELVQSQSCFGTEQPKLAKWLLRLYDSFTSCTQRTHEIFSVVTITLTFPTSRKLCSPFASQGFWRNAYSKIKQSWRMGFASYCLMNGSSATPETLLLEGAQSAAERQGFAWPSRSTHTLSACAASPPGFVVPQITTRNTAIATQ